MFESNFSVRPTSISVSIRFFLFFQNVRPKESTFDFEQLQNELNSASVKVTKNFQCDICKRSFATKLKIKKHMTIHIERPYDCKVCDKAFSREITLVRHIRKHTGEKPFNCNVCNEKFSLKRYLKVHTNTHK